MFVCVWCRRLAAFAKASFEVLEKHDELINLRRQLKVEQKRFKTLRRELRTERNKLPEMTKRHELCQEELTTLGNQRDHLQNQLTSIKTSQQVLTVKELNRNLESSTVLEAIECGEIDSSDIFRYVRRGDTRTIAGLLRDGIDVDQFKDRHGNTLLIVAVQCLEVKVVELLIKFGANVNLPNNSGNTPLHYALAYHPSGEIVQILLRSGADSTIKNDLGMLPFDGISQDDDPEEVESRLFDKARLVDAAFRAADEGKLEGIVQFMEYRFDLKTLMDADDRTLLCRLCRGASQVIDDDDKLIRVCKVLIEAGTKLDKQDRFGNTALHYALAAVPKSRLGAFLVESGADDTIENEYGESAYDGIGSARLASKRRSNSSSGGELALVVSPSRKEEKDDKKESGVAVVVSSSSKEEEGEEEEKKESDGAVVVTSSSSSRMEGDT